MVTATCHCGKISVEVDAAPAEVTDCNCSICRRYGTLWAYYSPKSVCVTGATDTYQRSEKRLFFHRCPDCGCVSHWTPADPARDHMGVNARLMPMEVLAKARVRHLDGADTWTSWIEDPPFKTASKHGGDAPQ